MLTLFSEILSYLFYVSKDGYDSGRHTQSSSAIDLVSLTATVGSLNLPSAPKVDPSRMHTHNYGSLRKSLHLGFNSQSL